MSDFINVRTARMLCPICEKPDWCMVKRDGTAVLCNRVESKQPAKGGGYMHDLDDREDHGPVRPLPRRTEPAPSIINWPDMVLRGLEQANDYYRIAPKSLGVTRQALRWLDMGWSCGSGAASFPMRDANEDVVGIRLRTPDGRKFAVRGSREGLFYPVGLPAFLAAEESPDFWLPEGPTDTAALWSIGVIAIGRPSCRGGARIIRDIISRLPRKPRVAIPADYDAGHGAGERGAEALAETIFGLCADVRIVTPPGAMKDVRQWISQAGATHRSIEYLRRAARPWRPAA